MTDIDISKYGSVGEFREDVKAKGYLVPLPMCQGLSQLMKAKNLTFQEAYSYLLSEGKIVLLENKTYIYDLSASKLWESN